MHLLRSVPGLRRVAIHPDGELGEQLDFRAWLPKWGFVLNEPMGSTAYGGNARSYRIPRRAGIQSGLTHGLTDCGNVRAPSPQNWQRSYPVFNKIVSPPEERNSTDHCVSTERLYREWQHVRYG